MSEQPYDTIVVGGGHNGLVCACYLAAGGQRVLVLERRSIVGGAAVTEEFYPGFRNSTASYTVSLLQRRVIEDLRLADHGLEIVRRPFANFLPLGDGRYLRSGVDLADTQAQFARFSKRDAERLPSYYEMLDGAAALLREQLLVTPPNVGGGWADGIAALKLGNQLRGAGIAAQRDFLDLFTKSAGDMLTRWFESAPVQAMFGFDSIVGNYASPFTPGSAYVLLHHVFGEATGVSGGWGHAVGGMGAITQAMRKEAEARGVEVRVDAGVARVEVDDTQRVAGVTLVDGTFVPAPRVAAGVNPKLLYQQLIDPALLDSDFRARIDGYRCASGTFRINVALSELPRFDGVPADDATRFSASGIIIAPSLDYMERAYHDARRDGWAREPVVEMLIPSTVDSTLAPAGNHVASLFCQQFAPELPDGRSWDDAKDAAVQTIFATVDRHAPNFSTSVLGYRALTPLDLEREFGLIGGDIFHGSLTLDQLFSMRPVLGHGSYRGPIGGLYMCGSGTHPGGGVTGAPGFNAAREILRDG